MRPYQNPTPVYAAHIPVVSCPSSTVAPHGVAASTSHSMITPSASTTTLDTPVTANNTPGITGEAAADVVAHPLAGTRMLSVYVFNTDL